MPQFIPKDTNYDIKYDYDLDEEVFKVALKVWNPTSLQWERMTQPVVETTGDLHVTMGDVEKATNGTYWTKFLYDYDVDGNCIYKGLHTIYNIADTDTSHYILRYIYDANGQCTKKQLGKGSWVNRAGLDW